MVNDNGKDGCIGSWLSSTHCIYWTHLRSCTSILWLFPVRLRC